MQTIKKQPFLFYLVSLTIYLIVAAIQSAGASPHPSGRHGTHSHGVTDDWGGKRYSDQYPNRRHARNLAANLSAGDPRTVRMIYFLPRDQAYRADVVQKMKDEILVAQSFFADQMEAHGYGRQTFRLEKDTTGEPIVHRVDGRQRDYNIGFTTAGDVIAEVEEAFNFYENVYFIAFDRPGGFWEEGLIDGGVGGQWSKEGGFALAFGVFDWSLVAHELGHAFGLQHDFRDGRFIMSYGAAGGSRGSIGQERLSPCHAESMSVHPFFNRDTPIEAGEAPTIELLSPRTYPRGATSVPIRLEVSDPNGLRQVILHAAQPDGRWSVKTCRGVRGRSEVIEFDYDGVIPSAHEPAYSRSTSLLNPLVHPIVIEAVDMNGDVASSFYGGSLHIVVFSEAVEPLSKISGDNQHGVPNTALPVPFVVELRDLDSGNPIEGVSVRFTVTGGGGRLSAERTETDYYGRAESRLTLGPNLGDNRVEVHAAGHTVTFNAVAGNAIEIPDPGLRAAIEKALNKRTGEPIAPAEMANLTDLFAHESNISDFTGLEHATNLTDLDLGRNAISDISPLLGLGLTKLTHLWLYGNSISDISSVSGLTKLTWLNIQNNNISDISSLSGLTNLTTLELDYNSISDISSVSDLTNLTSLRLWDNNITDVSPLSGLTNLTDLTLSHNNISDISSLSGLTDLIELWLSHNNISDLSPLVANTGLGAGDTIDVSANPLSFVSINTHIPTLRDRGVEVRADNLKPPTLEYLLSVSSGINLIHVPLRVSAVNGVAKTLTSISDLYDALGGASAVNFLITHDSSTQAWLSYFSPADRGSTANQVLTDDMGIIAGMKTTATIRLTGEALGTNGTSTIGLNQGLNLVGLPLRDSRVTRVSDLFTLDGIRGNVPVIILSDAGDFKSVGRAGDPGDVPITGGQGFLLTAPRTTTVTLSGEGWTNVSATAAAPQLLTGLPVSDTTAVLALKGSIVDEGTGLKVPNFRVTVKNLSTGREIAVVTDPDDTGYRSTIVDIETGRAATVGDVLEISAQSPNPFIGVKPLRYTVTAEDVKQSLIRLPELVAYEIPAETELLANYPNPFNPETWIPYRLAEDGFVTLTIYDGVGHAVRTIDVGHRVAAVYESRSKAIYWDGRNNLGEQVASGVYFYHLNVGDYSQTRKMLILK